MEAPYNQHHISRLLTVIVLSLFMSGCFVSRVSTKASQSADEHPHEATLHRWFWGQVGNTAFLDTTCVSESMQEVTMETTFWQGAITFISLGIYAPIDIKYFCAKVPSPEEPEPGDGDGF
jgi:hypothetical protein